MKFLENVDVGDTVWIKTVNNDKDTVYFDDIVIRKLKTKLETKTGEFLIKTGESIDNNFIIIEYNDDIKYEILYNKYIKLIDKMKNMSFDNNKDYENFIEKVSNLYKAYKKNH